jgi:hypothetical protein
MVSIFPCLVLPFTFDNLTWKSLGVIYTSGCTSVPGLMPVSGLHIPMSSLTLDLLTSNRLGSLILYDIPVYQVWCLSSKGFSIYRVNNYSISSLTFDLLTSKSIEVIDSIPVYLLWCLWSKEFSKYWVDSVFLYPV